MKRTRFIALLADTRRLRLKDGKILKNECFFGVRVNYQNNDAKE